MKKIQKFFIGFLGSAVFFAMLSIGYRALPISHRQELCCTVVSKQEFGAQLKAPIADWAQQQINSDFQGFLDQKITAFAVKQLYEEIREKIGPQILHYRILNNKLYKYIPRGSEYSSLDTLFERAFKTLLSYTKVPDLDFLLCPMDGIPEPYAPKDFFLAAQSQNQVPIFGQAKRKEPASQHIVLIPDHFSLTEAWRRDIDETLKANQSVCWEDKQEKAIWRGSLTDVGVPGDYAPNLEKCPRFIISQLSVQFPDQVNAGIHIAESPKTISILSHAHVIRGVAGKKNHVRYKYLPVLDGHMCTYPGYQWRLLSNSVAFKQQSDQIQWFYGALEPYKHYIPIQNDMSDLIEQIAWARAHDEQVREISKRAQEFALKNLMPANNYVYLLKVLERYAALQKIDFRALKTETRQDPKWECIQYRKRTRLMRTLRRITRFGTRPVCGVSSLKSLDQMGQCKAALQGSF